MDIRFAFKEAHETLKDAGRVLVVCHRRPDGDAIGSSTALITWLRSRGAQATGFCVDAVPEQYDFILGTEHFTSDPAVFRRKDWDAVVICDTGDLKHTGADAHFAVLPRHQKIVCFDHHATNPGYGHVNVIDAGASSASEIIYRFLRSLDAAITREMATALFTGIFSDTEGFTNAATNGSALEAASELMRLGAAIGPISSRARRNRTVAALRLWGKILARLKFDPLTGVSSTAIFRADSAEDHDQIDGLANFLNTYLDSDIVLVLTETKDEAVKGSFRAVGDIDVSAVAKRLGGGGHRKAAGFSLPGRIVEKDHGWQVVKT